MIPNNRVLYCNTLSNFASLADHRINDSSVSTYGGIFPYNTVVTNFCLQMSMLEFTQVLIEGLHPALSIKNGPINNKGGTSSSNNIFCNHLICSWIQDLPVIVTLRQHVGLYLIISELASVNVYYKVLFELTNCDIIVYVLKKIFTANTDFSVNNIRQQFVASDLLFQTNVLFV